MHARSVTSPQDSIHHRLLDQVRRYQRAPYQKPIAERSRRDFECLALFCEKRGGPIILDSACGTGWSSWQIAQMYPQYTVIGVDQSEKRLATSVNCGYSASNLRLIRADIVDIWRLAEQARWQLQKHFILYPNPWPKPEHLVRRWHAHPVFSSLIALSGELEVRSNWLIYLHEFREVLNHYQIDSQVSKVDSSIKSLSRFEDKYKRSGQDVFKLSVDLRKDGKPVLS